jgi:hypothetical protein
MGNTPTFQLPYPEQNDTADVPRDIKALATKLDGIPGLAGGLVTALPASPIDGQEIYFVANAATGVVWHLRYRAASASAYKWEYVGGESLLSEIVTQEGLGVSAAYGNFPTIGPQVPIPLSGDYRLHYAAYMTTGITTNAKVFVSIHLGVGVASDDDALVIITPANGGLGASCAREARKTLTAAQTLTMQGRSDVDLGSAGRRVLGLVPFRVG